LGIPLPNDNSITPQQQEQMDEFMNKSKIFELEIAYAFLLQAEWNVEEAVKQYNSAKEEYEKSQKKNDKNNDDGFVSINASQLDKHEMVDID